MLFYSNHLIQKYTYLTLCSLILLVSCSNNNKTSIRKYSKKNAEMLGITGSQNTKDNTSEQTIYNKIFKNYHGQSTYKTKKIPKNNQHHYKTNHLKQDNTEKTNSVKIEQNTTLPLSVTDSLNINQSTLKTSLPPTKNELIENKSYTNNTTESINQSTLKNSISPTKNELLENNSDTTNTTDDNLNKTNTATINSEKNIPSNPPINIQHELDSILEKKPELITEDNQINQPIIRDIPKLD